MRLETEANGPLRPGILKHQSPVKTNQADRQNQATCCAKPDSNPPESTYLFRELQERIGNRALGRLIQAKLEISTPGDKFEREADRVADQVMRMPDPAIGDDKVITTETETPQINRQCADCERETMRKVAEEEEVQTKKDDGAAPEADSAVEANLQTITQDGEFLSESTRAFFEPRFGRDFSGVKVHTDQQAAASAKSINAHAYTVSNDIVFGHGQYAPETDSGQRLLAHELTHVVQQSNGGESKLARWKIAGHTATMDSDQDSLSSLAVKASGYAADWPCIWPIKMKSAEAGGDEYAKYIQLGDTFDTSNLTDMTGKSLTISLGVTDSSDNWLAAVAAAYGANAPTELYDKIEEAADNGTTPIESLKLAGHTTGSRIWGEKGSPSLDLTKLRTDTNPNGLLAQSKQGPRRCWFTRKAKVELLGCDSQTLADAWANAWLRPQAAALGTNSWMCGWVSRNIFNKVVASFITAQPSTTCVVGGTPSGTQMRTSGAIEGTTGLWVTKPGKL